MLELNNDNFAENILTTNKPVLVQFTASWCSACKEFYPTLVELEQLYKDQITFAKVDTDQDSALADRFRIDRLPTFLLFKDREVIDWIIGIETLNHFKTRLDEALND